MPKLIFPKNLKLSQNGSPRSLSTYKNGQTDSFQLHSDWIKKKLSSKNGFQQQYQPIQLRQWYERIQRNR